MDGFRTALLGVWSGVIATMIREAFHNTDVKITDHTANGLYAVHQLTAELNGVKHRIIIAPMDAPGYDRDAKSRRAFQIREK